MAKLPKVPYSPLTDKLIVQPLKPNETTKGGLVLPARLLQPGRRAGMPEEPTRIGTVIKVGPDCKANLKPGEKIVYEGGYGEHDGFEHDDEQFHLIPERLVLCVQEES